MKITWPSAINPAVASIRRHVIDVHPHLTPEDERGLVVTTRVLRESDDVERRRVTAWARGQYLASRLDLTLLIARDAAWDVPIRLSPTMLTSTTRAIKAAGRGLYTIEFEPKTDSDLLQVVTIRRRDDTLVTKFAAEGLATIDERACPIPDDLATHPDATRLTTPPSTAEHRDADRLTKMAYPAATYHHLLRREHPDDDADTATEAFAARWWRSDFAAAAMTVRTP